MPSAQKPAGAEDAERALSRDQPVAADAAAPTPANQGSASAAGAEFTDEDLQQDPLGSGDLLDESKRVGDARPHLYSALSVQPLPQVFRLVTAPTSQSSIGP